MGVVSSGRVVEDTVRTLLQVGQTVLWVVSK